MSRRKLILGLASLGALLVAAGSYLLVGSMRPTDGSIQSHIIVVNLSAIPAGVIQRIDSDRGPIFVIHRTKEDLAALDTVFSQLRDPNSAFSHQPAYAQNRYRSVKPEWFIGFGLNHRGFPVSYTQTLPFGYEREVERWFGGFHDRYDGALFDKAGRVYLVGHPREENLLIPEHRYVAEDKVEIYPFGL